MFLVLTLLSPVLMALLVGAAVRIEQRLDGFSDRARRAPEPAQPAGQRRRNVLGLFRNAATSDAAPGPGRAA